MQEYEEDRHETGADSKWIPMEAVEKAQKAIESLGFPVIKEIQPPENFSWPNIHNSSDTELAEYLAVYVGNAGYMETEVSEVEAIITALEAAYNEGYSKAVYQVVTEYDEAGKKKPTKDELQGEILSKFSELREQKREIAGKQVELKRKASLLRAYSKLYDTVSRMVSLRTYGRQP